MPMPSSPPPPTEHFVEMRLKHLEMVQGVIERMSAASGQTKTSCIALITAIMALATALENSSIALIAAPSVILFALLDSWYLWLERGFRNRFDDVRSEAMVKITDFEMSARHTSSFATCIGSLAVWPFYSAVTCFVVVASICIAP
jgi:hypothetical protein